MDSTLDLETFHHKFQAHLQCGAGRRCTACDRPLPPSKLLGLPAAHINSHGVSNNIQMEFIKAHGVDAVTASTLPRKGAARSTGDSVCPTGGCAQC